MTTRGCCHLPGSLCDCASNAGLWKNVEEAASDGCQPLYLTQVTALDGRLLSSVLKPAGAQRWGSLTGWPSTGNMPIQWTMLYSHVTVSHDHEPAGTMVGPRRVYSCVYMEDVWSPLSTSGCKPASSGSFLFPPHVHGCPQRRPHLPHLPRRRQQRGPAVPVLLHGHTGHGAQELPGEVAVVLQHQLLRALPLGVQHRAAAAAAHRGNTGVPLASSASLFLLRSFAASPSYQLVFWCSNVWMGWKVTASFKRNKRCSSKCSRRFCGRVWAFRVSQRFRHHRWGCFTSALSVCSGHLSAAFLCASSPDSLPVITPGPITPPPLLIPQWLRDPGPLNEKRTLFCDMVCFLFITPLAAISGWLCLRGAQDHLHLGSWLQAVGLITLTIALFTIYVLWTLVGATSYSISTRPWCLKVTAVSFLRRYPSATTASCTLSGDEPIRKYVCSFPKRGSPAPPSIPCCPPNWWRSRPARV